MKCTFDEKEERKKREWLSFIFYQYVLHFVLYTHQRIRLYEMYM